MLEMQIKMRTLINPTIYNSLYPINYGCGYNPINYQICSSSNLINNGFIEKEAPIENKEVKKMQFDYNREFIYQSEWDKYGCDLDEYNSISDDDKRLFKDCNEIIQFSGICYYPCSESIYIKYSNFYYFGDEHDNCIKYSFLKKDFDYNLSVSTINKKLEQLNKKFQVYKDYKQNKKFIDKYYDKIVSDNIQTNYDYIEELIKESKE